MNSLQSSWYRDYLACPDCGGDLVTGEEILCPACGYRVTPSGTVELKPRTPRPVTLTLPRMAIPHPSDLLQALEIAPPEVTYDGPPAVRDSRQLMSEIHRYLGNAGAVLDLGCGPRDQAVPLAHLGYRYVGVDYSNERADLLADAHAIPFKDATFDCVLSYAVLEHLHNPFLALREIERVMKPGGVFIGTVSQGEPFHDSYFHHTAWGVISLVSAVTTLQLERLWSSGDTLGSLARMGRYPKMIRQLIRIVGKIHDSAPFLAPRRMGWSPREKMLDRLHRAGSICFVARKPAAT